MTVDEMGRCLTKLKMILTQFAPPEIDSNLAVMWIGILKEYSDEEIRAAFAKAASNFTKWPAPATIKRLCQGTFKSDEEHGQEIASRIESAMGSPGSNRYASRQEDIDRHQRLLLDKVGEIGMEVIRQCGGFNHICDMDNDQLPSARKQWRDLATVISKNFFTTGKNLPPALPEKRHPALAAALQLVANGTQN